MTPLSEILVDHLGGNVSGLAALVIALAVMVSRVARPFGARHAGTTLYVYRLPALSRLRRQRLPLAALAAVAAVDAAVGLVPAWAMSAAALVAGIVLVTPVRCVLSTAGVRIGWRPVRRWTEFAGLRVRRGAIQLRPIAGSAGLELPLPGRFEDGDLVAEVRRLITRAYKGSSVSAEDATAEEAVDETATTPLAIA
jgi:hypothetical protein